MYHAITGTIPPSSIDRILKDSYEPLGELAPEGFAPELLAGIDAGMVLRGEERPHNIAQWRHALRSGEVPVQSIETTQIERRPRRSRRGGFALRGPALWGAAAAAALMLAGAGWLAYTTQGPPAAGTATLALSTEQLEQVLAERRRADALAAEKRRVEDEARQKAAAETEAKRQAEEELQRAREARQKAEQELEQLKARIAAQSAAVVPPRDQPAADEQRAREAEAQRQAEAQAVALRAAEEEARQKAEADAEAKRRADEALAAAEAERQRADQEATAKVEAEKQALQKSSEEAQRKAADAERQTVAAEAKVKAEAEAAEKALKLEPADRQRLQVALTSLGFDTRGNDGLFGPRSREMIAGWQKARNHPSSGYVNADQQQRLLKEAAPALAKLEEKQKADEEAKARATALAIAAPRPAISTGSSVDRSYSGTLYGASVKVSLQISRGAGTVVVAAPGCEPIRFPVSISSDGTIAGKTYINCSFGASSIGSNLRPGDFEIDGRVQGDQADHLWFRNSANTFKVALRRETSAVTKYDGTYKGDVDVGGYSGSAGRLFAELVVRNGNGTGTFTSPGCRPSPVSLTISPAGDISGQSDFACILGGSTNITGRLTISGRSEDNVLRLLVISERGGGFRMRLPLGG
jgi:peptidoglycan hydrolase-like protein with peptidoglycan-binding domain